MSDSVGFNTDSDHECDDFLEPDLRQRFRVIRKLGTGGMGNVYLADDIQLLRQVAIKSIRPDLVTNEEVQKRIGKECLMHASIGVHPNIVALYDRIESNGNIYLIMEYVEGILLSELLATQFRDNPQYSLGNCIDIIGQVLEGLAQIHEKNIIHRDIKPSNIITRQQSTGKCLAKLMDFGIARAETEAHQLTQLTTLDTSGPGTPAYMSPERIDAKTFGAISSATDLYSVGVILFQMLSDGPPFRGTLTEIFIGHLTCPPDLSLLQSNIPKRLRLVVEKALQKEQVQRYKNARHFAADLFSSIEEDNSNHYRHSSSMEPALTDQTMLASEITSAAAYISNAALYNVPINKKIINWDYKKFIDWIKDNRRVVSLAAFVLVLIFLSSFFLKKEVAEKVEPALQEPTVVPEPQIVMPATATEERQTEPDVIPRPIELPTAYVPPKTRHPPTSAGAYITGNDLPPSPPITGNDLPPSPPVTGNDLPPSPPPKSIPSPGDAPQNIDSDWHVTGQTDHELK